MTEWREKKLGDVALFIDYRGKTPRKTATGIPLITAKIVKNGTILPPNEFIASEDYDAWMTRGLPRIGDVVLTTEAPLGEVAQLKDAHVALAQRIITLRANADVLDNTFLKYFLQSAEGQRRLKMRESGTTVTGIKSSELQEVLIPLPELETQKRIARILSSLDDKIEVNNQINRNLEEQAKAIFKSWFVDFEPFRGGEFIDSELGRIPKGWKVGKFTDVVHILGGGTPKTSMPEYWNGTIPFFTPKDVGDSIYTFATEKNLTEEGLNNCNSRLYPENTVFVTARGTVGKLALAGVPMAMNQSCYALVGKNVSPLFVFFLALQVVETLKKIANGAVFDAIVTRDFETKSVIIPPEEAINRFVELIAPLFKMIHSNVIQNTTLVQSRDTLLPKLMSGEIDIHNKQQ